MQSSMLHLTKLQELKLAKAWCKSLKLQNYVYLHTGVFSCGESSEQLLEISMTSSHAKKEAKHHYSNPWLVTPEFISLWFLKTKVEIR